MTKRTAAFIIISCLPVTNLFSQTEQDIALGYFIIEEEYKEEYHFSFQGNNELENLGSFLFVFYKKFISSQDMQVCNFYPSCSVYATEVIREKGMIVGTMATYDRMSRCHPLAPGHYPVHTESGLLYDPVVKAQ